jgi:hypothetical protein
VRRSGAQIPIAECEQMLKRTGEVSAVTVVDTSEADAKTTAWFREWAGLADIAITDRKSRRALGFLKRKRPSAEGDDEVTEPGTAVAPTPSAPAAPSAATGAAATTAAKDGR